MPKKNDIQPGDTFGRLTVIKQVESVRKPSGSMMSKFLCRCNCGKELCVLGQNLRTGNTKSCGCLVTDMRLAQKLPDNRGVINQVILGYKRHARDRNLVWDLCYDDVKRIINEPCFYCGAEKTNTKITKNCKEGYSYNGIDRVDNSKGYTIDNVVSCCKRCNTAKSNME